MSERLIFSKLKKGFRKFTERTKLSAETHNQNNSNSETTSRFFYKLKPPRWPSERFFFPLVNSAMREKRAINNPGERLRPRWPRKAAEQTRTASSKSALGILNVF